VNKIQTFEQFLTTQSTQIVISTFLVNLTLAAVLSFILAKIYVRSGTSLSNREMFSKNFMIITLTTMFIITVVKSSLALSLGLVGALSIVRFRAAIKEPEELAYLFLAISIGLGLGAGQTVITLIAFTSIITFISIFGKFKKVYEHKYMFLTITATEPKELQINEVSSRINKHCTFVDLKRFDDFKDAFEALFQVELESLDKLQNIKNDLRELNKTIGLSFLDNKRNV